MSVRRIGANESVGAARGQVVVCVPVRDAYEHFVLCLRSVLVHTSDEVPVLICDDASRDPRIYSLLEETERSHGSRHHIFYVRHESNVGFPANVNGAIRAASPADVVVLNSDCIVAEGWLEGLRDAAQSDSRVATVTALSNHGSIVSVPVRGMPSSRLPSEWTFDEAAAAVREASLRIRPRLPTAIGHCMLLRRSALELVGDFDLAFSPGYGEEVDFSQRCLRSGLSHVVADEVLVFHHGSASFGHDTARGKLQEEHERLIEARYPYYTKAVAAVEADESGPLSRAIGAARRALVGLSVVIDGRTLAGPMTGTQLQVLEVIAALARSGRAEMTVVVPDNPGSYAVAILSGLPQVRLMGYSEAAARLSGADVVHRPFQVNSEADLTFLSGLGERLIITNQDLIAYHNPSYFNSGEAWQGYRRLTRTALAVADHVVFISRHALQDALSEDLADPARASVVPNGVIHSLSEVLPEPVAPRGAARLDPGSVAILCLGTDFRHKNRLFAMRLLEFLQSHHGWQGALLLAGPRVSSGSSAPEEGELLARSPALASTIIDFAAVSEAEKNWLFQRARLVLYPTVHEGFGLIPFESAQQGVPCLWAAGTSLSEILPDEAAGLVPWDVEASAASVLRMLNDEEARRENLSRIERAASPFSWDSTAARLLDLYGRVADAPAARMGAFERRDGLLDGAISDDAMRLVGPDGALPREVERPLLALATHPSVGRPLFGVIKTGYRMGFRLARVARPPGRSASADLKRVR